MKIDHISYSQLDLYLNCPRKWWFQKVKYPQETIQTWPLALGSAYHEAQEAMAKGGDMNKVLETFQGGLGKWGPRLAHNQLKEAENMMTALRFYYENIFPKYSYMIDESYIEVMDTEFMIDGIDVPIHVRIDLRTLDNGIIDHKTVGRVSPTAKKNKQLLIYSYWHLKKMKTLPAYVELHKAYKFPKYDKDPVEVVRENVNLADVMKTVEQLRAVYKLITEEVYNPSPSYLCNYCQFKDECDRMSISGI